MDAHGTVILMVRANTRMVFVLGHQHHCTNHNSRPGFGLWPKAPSGKTLFSFGIVAIMYTSTLVEAAVICVGKVLGLDLMYLPSWSATCARSYDSAVEQSTLQTQPMLDILLVTELWYTVTKGSTRLFKVPVCCPAPAAALR